MIFSKYITYIIVFILKLYFFSKNITYFILNYTIDLVGITTLALGWWIALLLLML